MEWGGREAALAALPRHPWPAAASCVLRLLVLVLVALALASKLRGGCTNRRAGVIDSLLFNYFACGICTPLAPITAAPAFHPHGPLTR